MGYKYAGLFCRYYCNMYVKHTSTLRVVNVVRVIIKNESVCSLIVAYSISVQTTISEACTNSYLLEVGCTHIKISNTDMLITLKEHPHQ